MAQWGHEFDDADDSTPEASETTHPADSPEIETTAVTSLATRKISTTSDIEDILPETPEVTRPLRGNICSWIEKQYRGSRGFEIGTFNSVLLSTLMKKQSSKWTSLSHGYISDVTVYVHFYIVSALHLACPDARVCNSLLSILMDQLLERYKKAVDQVTFLLSVERSGTPTTLNHYLNDSLQKWYCCSFMNSLAQTHTNSS